MLHALRAHLLDALAEDRHAKLRWRGLHRSSQVRRPPAGRQQEPEPPAAAQQHAEVLPPPEAVEAWADRAEDLRLELDVLLHREVVLDHGAALRGKVPGGAA